MSHLTVLRGLVDLAGKTDVGLAHRLLANSGAKPREVGRFLGNNIQLRVVGTILDHYKRDDGDLGEALFRIATGAGGKPLGRNTEAIESALSGGINSGIARAVIVLNGAVEKASPRAMVQIKPGRYVNRLGTEGKPEWEETKSPFSCAVRPVAGCQFRALAEAGGIPIPRKPSRAIQPSDPVLVATKDLVAQWIELLNLLSCRKYRLPTHIEWERATGGPRRLVSLRKKNLSEGVPLISFMKNQWFHRYANAFLGSPDLPIMMGGTLINDPEAIRRLLQEGLDLSAWDFLVDPSDTLWIGNVYEITSDPPSGPDLLHQIGLRNFLIAEEMYPNDAASAVRERAEKNRAHLLREALDWEATLIQFRLAEDPA